MIAVVGGGITGLAIGRELARMGADFVVLEAEERPGGVVRSTLADGRVLEWGPQRARLTPMLAALVAELGLGDRLRTAPMDLDLFVWRAGGLRPVPLSVRALLRPGVVSASSALRLMVEPLTGPARPRERVARYFTRKLGRALYEGVVGPLFGGLYGTDPADMEVDTALAPLLAQFGVRRSLVAALLRRGAAGPVPACSFEGGMQELPDALARALGSRIHLAAPVERVTRLGPKWRVHAGGEMESIDADDVVIATQADVAARLLADVAPDAAARIGALRYNPLAIVQLEADTGVRGLGFQVGFETPPPMLRGVTFHDCLFGRSKLCTAFLGGARHPEVVELDEDALGVLAASELRRTLGCEARPLAAAHVRMPAWDLSWSGLADIALPPGLHVAGGWWSRPGLPGRFAEARRVAEKLHATD